MTQRSEIVNSMRECSLCAAADYHQVLPDLCSCGGRENHANGCNAVQHYVVRDIKHHDGVITAAMAKKGWAALGLFLGKPAVQRFLCRQCMRRQEEITEIEQYRKKKGQELEQGQNIGMYQVLCN